MFKHGNGEEELSKLYLKGDVILLICVCEEFVRVSIVQYEIHPFFYVNAPDFKWLCGFKGTSINLQTLQDARKRNNYVFREYYTRKYLLSIGR